MAKTLKAITTKLDNITRSIVRCRDQKCITCGKEDRARLQLSHVITRSSISTRWDMRNCNLQCSGCHLKWHAGFTEPYHNYLKAKWGPEIIVDLHRDGNRTAVEVDLKKLHQREDLYESMKKEYEEMEGDKW